jgi:hypothetical protein
MKGINVVPNTDYKVQEFASGFIIELSNEAVLLEEQICQALERKNVGRFFGGGHLRFEGKSPLVRAQILSTLEELSISELRRKNNEWEEARRIEQAAREEFLNLTPNQFSEKLNTVSNHKLVPQSITDRRFLAVKTMDLIPVTHFKKLAQLGRWNSKTRCFEYALPLTPALRDKLYAAATALGRSTKKVTTADIATRRKRIREACNKLDMDFMECAEDFDLDFAIKMRNEGRLVE